MAELLFELLSEEIPAHMQARAADDLRRLVTDRLTEAGLAFESAQAFVTPRRLALVVEGLPARQPDVAEERRGPRTDAPEKAIQGFLGSAGLTLDQCERRKTPKGEFYFAAIERKGLGTHVLLGDALIDVMRSFPWPKSMRWEATGLAWARPLHRILCLFDGSVVPMRYAGAEAGDRTAGHRFLDPEPFKVKDFADYKAKLEKAKVMPDLDKRREAVWRDAAKLASNAGLTVKPDDGLLAEVAGLVEWPVVLMGRIDQAFMDLPPEVLTTVMRHHQKYFALLDKHGGLAPRFVFVAGTEATDGGRATVAGNERVLNARLADARYFWNRDRRQTLESRVPALGDVVFHAGLGSLREKAERVARLARRMCDHVPGADPDPAERAARLAKADLTTGMVGEFPELQGIMGRYYAVGDGEEAALAEAIAEHYAPQGPGDRCPSAPVSVAVALADKIDTLVGFFAIGERPTGSKDPFALRRAALGALRLIVENGLRIPLVTIFEESRSFYEERRGEFDPAALLDFFADRLKVHLREKGVRHDLISAVFALGGEDDIVRLLARVEALQDFLSTDDGEPLLVAYKRAANIVRIEERNDGKDYAGEANESLLGQAEEKTLYRRLSEAAPRVADNIREERFGDGMAVLAQLRAPVDAFFDRVTVNCDDGRLRENRLRLLSQIRSALGGVADFSKIEG